jgi:hypothetical protein
MTEDAELPRRQRSQIQFIAQGLSLTDTHRAMNIGGV